MPKLIDVTIPEHREAVEALEHAAQVCTRLGLEYMLSALVTIEEDGRRLNTMAMHTGPRCSYVANRAEENWNAALSWMYQSPVKDVDDMRTEHARRLPDGTLATDAEAALLSANPNAETPQ